MDTDKHMVGTQTKANTLDDKGIRRMCHHGFFWKSWTADQIQRFSWWEAEQHLPL